MTASSLIAQERFDKTYITSTEICRRLSVTRPAIHFRRKAGHLPNSISVFGQNLLIWERAAVEPYLVTWEKQVNEKRSAVG